LKVSNFEQTIAVYVCCFGNHRGIALSGPNPTPPRIIGLGGVVLSRVSAKAKEKPAELSERA
jgi:hypothetical protein